MLTRALLGLPPNASRHRLRIIDVLLRMGARLSATSGMYAPLEVAVGKRMPGLVEMLVSHPAVDPDDVREAVSGPWASLLVPLVRHGDLKTIKLLTELGASADALVFGVLAETPFAAALWKQDRAIIDFFLDGGHVKNPNFDVMGNTYISIAMQDRRMSASYVPRLLALGCDPRRGNTPALTLAVRYGDMAVFERLLRDPRALETGPGALEEACGKESTAEFASLLVEAGVDAEPLLARPFFLSIIPESCRLLLEGSTRVGMVRKLRYVHEMEQGLAAPSAALRRRARKAYAKACKTRGKLDRRNPWYETNAARDAAAAGVLGGTVAMGADAFEQLVGMLQ